jgi:hypothetical protein
MALLRSRCLAMCMHFGGKIGDFQARILRAVLHRDSYRVCPSVSLWKGAIKRDHRIHGVLSS